MNLRPFILAVVSASLTGVTSSAQQPGTDYFEKKIRPVLVEHCYSCHSAKKQRGGLVLDTSDGVRQGGDSGPAIVAGKPDESLLIKAVRYDDPDLRMPPKGKLPGSVVADLEKWIAMGAPDPRTAKAAMQPQQPGATAAKGWAYQSPQRHPVPAVKDTAWPRSDVDRFLLARLEQAGLKPAADADRATLVRRAYFALIGLPPTPEQIDAFVNDPAREAFAKVVDELLTSRHFGERWGRHWLDVARYAESSGGGRSLLFKDAWRFRDYVIDAFNADRPFDRFIFEQVAGDLLAWESPEERQRQLIATAFLLLGPTNYELQDKPILEMDIIDEQLDTLGRAFLGMTIGCARCHDHKFDPIPHRDYYALAGILKSTKGIIHENVSRWTEHPLPAAPEVERAIKTHAAAVAELKEKIKVATAGKGTALAAQGAVEPAELPGIVIDDRQAKVVGHWKQSKFSGVFVGDGYLYDERAIKEEKTVTFIPDFDKGGMYEVRLSYIPHTNRATNVPVRIFHADGDNTVHVNQRLTPPLDGRFVSLGKFRFEAGNQWFVMVATDGADGHVVADAVQFLAEDAASEVKTNLAAYAVRAPAGAKALEAELKALIAKAPERPMAMAVSDDSNVEDCHICIRGNVHNKGPIAPRGFLTALLPDTLQKSPALDIGPKQSGRLQLAAWLASPDNPLTARVAANRVWHHVFGSGIVRTVDNFGVTGEAPSHPELLDFLAQRFVEQGWSIKKLIRELMLTRAYQQASSGDMVTTQRAAKVDPENRLFWRMNRHRLEAECIRDAMLAVSGSLDPTMHGPLITKATLEREYRFEDARRSIYTPVLRNRLHELFEVFDFANPNACLGARSASTVAPQALYFMNSPFVMDQARRAAQLLAQTRLDDNGRLERLYRLALGRVPTPRERELALTFLSQSAQRDAGWERVCQALFGCVDFRYVN